MTRRGALVTLALLALTLVAAWFLLVYGRCGAACPLFSDSASSVSNAPGP